MKYFEFKKKQREDFAKLPMKVAFGEELFSAMLKEWGLTTSYDDVKKILLLGAGGYCLREDEHLFIEYFERATEEKKNFLSNDEQLKDAFMYEFSSHECGYTNSPYDALEELGITRRDLDKDARLKRIFNQTWYDFLEKY